MYPLAMHKGSYEKAKTIVCDKSFKFSMTLLKIKRYHRRSAIRR